MRSRVLTNILLVAAIALLAVLIVQTTLTSRTTLTDRPKDIVHAESGAGVFAFPVQSLGGGRPVLCLVDTNRQEICVYELSDALRLVAARTYAWDIQVADSSKIPGLGLNSRKGTVDAIKKFVASQAGAGR